jgi:hypothetical protein
MLLLVVRQLGPIVAQIISISSLLLFPVGIVAGPPSEVSEWRFEYWEWKPKGDEDPKELPKDAKLVATIVLYRLGAGEAMATAKSDDFEVRAAVSPGKKDSTFGSVTKVGFSITIKNPNAIIPGAGHYRELADKKIEFGKRKIISDGGAVGKSLRFITLTVTKNARKPLEYFYGGER